MAGGLSAFLAQNAVKPENIRFAASRRFVDEDGKPMLWELRPLMSEEDEALRRRFTRMVQVPGKSSQFRQEFDSNGYLAAMAAGCTVFPNLNDKGLQDSYVVMGAEALLKAMLTSGESANYFQKAQEVCGFTPIEELTEQAKN